MQGFLFFGGGASGAGQDPGGSPGPQRRHPRRDTPLRHLHLLPRPAHPAHPPGCATLQPLRARRRLAGRGCRARRGQCLPRARAGLHRVLGRGPRMKRRLGPRSSLQRRPPNSKECRHGRGGGVPVRRRPARAPGHRPAAPPASDARAWALVPQQEFERGGERGRQQGCDG